MLCLTMVREEILEGLRAAVAKGEPLRKAMMSFYNAGYSKKDIEESARALQTPQFQQTQPVRKPAAIPQTSPVQKPQPFQPVYVQPLQPQPPVPVQPVQSLYIQSPSGTIQKVSGYGEKPRPFSLIITFILIFFLLSLIGVLIAVFLFKNELTEFFNSIL